MAVITINGVDITIPDFVPQSINIGDTTGFVSKFNTQQTLLDSMQAVYSDIAAAVASVSGSPEFTGTSTTSETIGTGSKTLTIETGKSFVTGQEVKISDTTDPVNNSMSGSIVSYNDINGVLVVNITSVSGSGTLASWNVSLTFETSIPSPASQPDDKILKTTGGELVYDDPPASAGGFVGLVVLTSGTSYVIPAGVSEIKAKVQGAGTGGAFSPTFGYNIPISSTGAYCEKVFDCVAGESITYAIGSGGAGANAQPGLNAGSLSSLTYTAVAMIANGGPSSPGTRPSASGGDLNLAGTGIGISWSSGQNVQSSSAVGERNQSMFLGGYGYGGGGKANSGSSEAGGNGIIVLELYS